MDHNKIYADFLKAYTSGQTTGEEVGAVISQLAQCFSAMSQQAVKTEFMFNKKHAALVDGVDEAGKAVSAAKAEVIAKASDEYNAYNESRKELAAIENEINALKSLQRGVMNEYAYANNQ